MNQTQKNLRQTDITEQRAAVEQELRLAKEYWLGTIQPFIAGQILRGVEFFIAQHAHWLLQKAVEKAAAWNHLCDGQILDGVELVVAERSHWHLQEAVKKNGDWNYLSVSVDVDLSAENFCEPIVPEMLFADNVKSEILAAIAAPRVPSPAERTQDEAIRNAHERLMAAERYIGTLPKKREGIEFFHADIEHAFSKVTFAQIRANNDPGRLPLLLRLSQPKKGISGIIDRTPLSVPAIKKAVKIFLHEQTPSISQEQYEQERKQQDRLVKAGMLVQLASGSPMSYQAWQQSNQDAIDDCLKNNRISLQDLCTMRWERFKKSGQVQQSRAIAREANKRVEAEAKASKGKLPNSVTTSPAVAGKRRK